MDDATLTARLDAIRQQSYPLEISFQDAEALIECFQRIMATVPKDEQILVRADYDDATSALFHPSP